jgi:hypothetical protein
VAETSLFHFLHCKQKYSCIKAVSNGPRLSWCRRGQSLLAGRLLFAVTQGAHQRPPKGLMNEPTKGSQVSPNLRTHEDEPEPREFKYSAGAGIDPGGSSARSAGNGRPPSRRRRNAERWRAGEQDEAIREEIAQQGRRPMSTIAPILPENEPFD